MIYILRLSLISLMLLFFQRDLVAQTQPRNPVLENTAGTWCQWCPCGDVEFNASSLASGIYFYRIMVVDPSTGSGQGFVVMKKMVLIK